jgi:hypothetical protein
MDSNGELGAAMQFPAGVSNISLIHRVQPHVWNSLVSIPFSAKGSFCRIGLTERVSDNSVPFATSLGMVEPYLYFHIRLHCMILN